MTMNKAYFTEMKFWFLFLLFFAVLRVSAQDNITLPSSDWEKVDNGDGTFTVKYKGNRMLRNLRFGIMYSVKISAEIPIVSYDDGSSLGKVTAKFKSSQIGSLKMIVTGDKILKSELVLKSVDADGNGTFEGALVVDGNSIPLNSALTGTISIDGSATFSAVSMDDLLDKCGHNYTTVGMTLDGTEVVKLTDKYAYLHFKLASTQFKLSLSLGVYSTFSTNSEIWLAVLDGTIVRGNLISKTGKAIGAGKIYTIDRHDVVDLGLSVLWKIYNEGASTPSGYGNLYKWTPASNNFGTAENPKAGSAYRLPTKAEYENLLSVKPAGGWTTVSGVNGWKFENEYGSVFLPAAGYNDGVDPGSRMGYWSGELKEIRSNGTTYFMYYYDNNYAQYGHLPEIYWSYSSGVFTVRLVREVE